jgi:penicillin amidase
VVYRVRVALPRLIELDDRTVTGGASWPDLISEARDRAVATLAKALGEDRSQWRWDRMHVSHTRHPVSRVLPDASGELDPPTVICGGDGECVNCTGWENAFIIEHGSVARYVFDVGDWERSGWVVPLGASGDSRSAHYADQAESWSRVELHPMTYAWDRVESGAESAQRLEPDK